MKMNLFFIVTTFFFINPKSYAWDFSVKADTQRASTDNVNLSSSATAISDTYSTFGGYLQTKNDTFKLKLKGKFEKYSKQTENNNYFYDLSLQYKRNKNNDYTFSVFKQVYDGVPLVSTDTTSDNNGGRFSTTFSTDLDKETSGYLILNGTLKNYTKMANRKDTIIGGSLGLEHYFYANLLFNPEFVLASNNSTESYYKNNYYGPSLLISFNPTENWELFLSGSFSRTNYSGRSIQTIAKKNRPGSVDEYQELATYEIGGIYTIANLVPVQVKYSTNKNTSNNSASAYKAGILSFNISIKF